MLYKLITFILFFHLLYTKCFAQENFSNLFIKKELIINNDTLRYRLSMPPNFDSTKKYPLILFLHGSGERGWDNEDILVKHGGRFFTVDSNRNNYPAFVLIPQCKPNSWWSVVKRDESKKDSIQGAFYIPANSEISKDMQMVIYLVENWGKEKFIYKKRISVGGLSMGGMGTFEILWRKPNFFHKAFPICGAGDETKVGIYAKNTKIKIFHGENDIVVRPYQSVKMYNALKKYKAKAQLTLYKGVQHNSWYNAFAEPQFMKWITSK